ncbi:MAG: hypothetical protein ACOY5B_14425 [Spirochaetota bacterium]
MRKVLLLVFSSIVILAPLMGQAQKAKAPTYSCYWMENASGRFEWVPAEVGGMYGGEGYERCFALDSCSGGLGESSGGCYKWARAANAPAVNWVNAAPQQNQKDQPVR